MLFQGQQPFGNKIEKNQIIKEKSGKNLLKQEIEENKELTFKNSGNNIHSQISGEKKFENFLSCPKTFYNPNLISFEVSSDESILQIKKKIEMLKSIPLIRQRLIFEGIPLEESKKISEYSIINGSKIFCIVNLSKKTKRKRK